MDKIRSQIYFVVVGLGDPELITISGKTGQCKGPGSM